MWQLFESRFTKSTCEQIISFALSLPEEEAIIGSKDADPRLDSKVRRSQIRWINPVMPNFKDLCLDMEDMFRETNRCAFGAELSHIFGIQFTKYDSSDEGFYDWHNDVLWESHSCFHRKLSMSIQLSDPSEYEGGDLEIQPLHLGPPDPTTLRKQGNVIIFPSFLKHRVTPVTKGTRYSMVAWMEGPKWR